MQHNGECPCVSDLAQLQHCDEFAEHIACHFADTMGGKCPPMMDFLVERIVTRLVHMAVWNHDENLEHSERKTLDAVAAYFFRLSKTAPATLKIIMDEAAKKGQPNAHH